MGTSVLPEPIDHLQKIVGHRRKATNLFGFGRQHTGNYHFLVNIEAAATFAHDIHENLSSGGLVRLKGWCNDHIRSFYPMCFPMRERHSVVHLVVVVSLFCGLKVPSSDDLPSPVSPQGYYSTPGHFHPSAGAAPAAWESIPIIPRFKCIFYINVVTD